MTVTETTAGLTRMLKSASEKGYRKVVLPAGGKYRLDEVGRAMKDAEERKVLRAAIVP